MIGVSGSRRAGGSGDTGSAGAGAWTDGDVCGSEFFAAVVGVSVWGVMKFVDRAALPAYGTHPPHQKLLEWLMPLIAAVEVDFEG
jgi:hypothetical protein